MRGDSLRDLYAKSLALLGLGLLAGVGALVDYWPVGVTVPQVGAVAFAMPEAYTLEPARHVTIAVRVAEPPASTPAASPAAALATVEPLPVVAATPASFGQSVRLTELVAPPEVAVTAAVAAPAPEVPLLAPEVFRTASESETAPRYHLASNTADDEGMLAGALDAMNDAMKATGSTIARGGAKTGASIVVLGKVMSSAFRKLKFF